MLFRSVVFEDGKDEIGPVMGKLRETLTGIQAGTIRAPEGWIVKVCDAEGNLV